MATSVSIADVFVQITSKLDDVFAGIDKMADKLDELSKKEIPIKIKFDDKSEKDINKIAQGVDRITQAIDTMGKLGGRVLQGFGVSMATFETKVTSGTGKVKKELKSADGALGQRLSKFGSLFESVFNPRVVATVFSVGAGLALLAENGFSFGKALLSIGISGTGSFKRLNSEARTFASTFSLASFLGIARAILGIIGEASPKLFGIVGIVSLLATSVNRIVSIAQGFLLKNPTSFLAQAANLMGSLNKGLFGLEFRLQRNLAMWRLIPGIGLLVATSFTKVSLGLGGLLSAGPLAVAGINVGIGLVKILSVTVNRAVVRMRARLGDGAAQFQLFLFGLRQLGPILAGIGKIGVPIGRMLEKLAKMKPAKIKAAVVGTIATMLEALKSLVANVQKLVTLVDERLGKVPQVVDKVAASVKRLKTATKRSSRGPPGGGSSILEDMIGVTGRSKDAIIKNTGVAFDAVVDSLGKGTKLIRGSLDKLTTKTKTRFTSFITGALVLKSNEWVPAVFSGLSNIVSGMGNMLVGMLTGGESGTGFVTRSAQAFRAAMTAIFGGAGIMDGVGSSLTNTVKGLFAFMFNPAAITAGIGAQGPGIIMSVLGGLGQIIGTPFIWKPLMAIALGSIIKETKPFFVSLKNEFKSGFSVAFDPAKQAILNQWAKITALFTRGAVAVRSKLRDVFAPAAMRGVLGGLQLGAAILTRMIGMKKVSSSLISAAGRSFNKSGITPMLKIAFRSAGAAIPGLFSDMFKLGKIGVKFAASLFNPANAGKAINKYLQAIGGNKLFTGLGDKFNFFGAGKDVKGFRSSTAKGIRGAAKGADPVIPGFETEAERLAAAAKPFETKLVEASKATSKAANALESLEKSILNLVQIQNQRAGKLRSLALAQSAPEAFRDPNLARQLIKAKQEELTATQSRIRDLLTEVAVNERVNNAGTNKRRKAIMAKLIEENQKLFRDEQELKSSVSEAGDTLDTMAIKLRSLIPEFPALEAVMDQVELAVKNFGPEMEGVGAESKKLREAVRTLTQIQQTVGNKTKPLTGFMDKYGNALNDFINGVSVPKGMDRVFGKVLREVSNLAINSDSTAGAIDTLKGESDELTTALNKMIVKIRAANSGGVLEFLGGAAADLNPKQLLAAQKILAEKTKALGLAEDKAKAALEAVVRQQTGRLGAAGETGGIEAASQEDPEGVTDALVVFQGSIGEMKKVLDEAGDALEATSVASKTLTESVIETAKQQDKLALITRALATEQNKSLGRVKQSNAQETGSTPGEAGFNPAAMQKLLLLLSKGAPLRTDIGSGPNRGDPSVRLPQLAADTAKGNVGRVSDTEEVKKLATILAMVADTAGTAEDKFNLLLESIMSSSDETRQLELMVGVAKQLRAVFADVSKGGLQTKPLQDLFNTMKGSSAAFGQLAAALSSFEVLGGASKGLQGVLAPFVAAMKKGGKTLVGKETEDAIKQTITRALVTGMQTGVTDAKVIAQKLAVDLKALLTKGGVQISPSALGLSPAALEKAITEKLKRALKIQAQIANGDIAAMGPEFLKQFRKIAKLAAKSFNKMGSSIGKEMISGKGDVDKAVDALLAYAGTSTKFQSPPTTGPLSKSIPTFARMGATIATEMVKGKGAIKKGTDKLLEYTAGALLHKSPPQWGPLAGAESSFRLLGSTLAQSMLRGVADLRQGIATFLGLGTGDTFLMLQQLLLAPFQLVFKAIGVSAKGVEKGLNSVVVGFSQVFRLIPLFGGPLRKLTQAFGSFAAGLIVLPLKMVASIGSALVSLTSFIGKTSAKLFKFLARVSQETFRMGVDAQRAGIGIEKFDFLGQVGSVVDVQATEISQAFIVLKQNMARAAREGSGPMVEAFNNIGLSVDQLKSTQPEEVFVRVARSLSNLNAGTEEYNQVLEVLGASMTNLRALLANPATFNEGIRFASAQLQLVEADRKAAKNLQTLMKILNNTTRTLKQRFATALDPLIVPLRELLLRLLPKLDVASKGFFIGITKGVKRLAVFGKSFFDDFLATGAGRKKLLDGIRGGITLGGDWLLEKLDFVVSKLPEMVAFFAKQALPNMVTFIAALLIGAWQVGVSLGAKLAAAIPAFINRWIFDPVIKFMNTVFGSSFNPTGDASIDETEAEMQRRADQVIADNKRISDQLLKDTRSLVGELTGTDAANFSSILGDPKDANPLITKAREFQALIKTVIFGDIPDGIAQAKKGVDGAADSIARITDKLAKMNTKVRQTFNSFLFIMKRSIEIEDGINSIVDKQSLAGDAASSGRRRRQQGLEAIQKLQAQSGGLAAKIATAIKLKGGEGAKAVAKRVSAELEDVLVLGLGKALDKMAKGATPEKLEGLAKALQKQFDTSIESARSELGIDIPVNLSTIDILGLIKAINFEMTGTEEHMATIANIGSDLQAFSSGWVDQLGEAGLTINSIELQFDVMVNKLKGSSAEQRKILGEMLGIEQATTQSIIARLVTFKDIAIAANKARRTLERLDSDLGIVKTLFDGAGDLGGAFDTASVIAKRIPAQIDLALASLESMLLKKPELLGMYKDWLKLTGDQKDVMKAIRKELEGVLIVSEKFRKLREIQDQVNKIDDILRRPLDTDPFAALQDQMGLARTEAARLRQELTLANEETKALFEIMARKNKPKLISIAKQLQDAGSITFKAELLPENAQAIAAEMADATKAAMDKAIRNVKIAPLAEKVRETIGAPLVSTFSETLRGLADGSIFEAARAAKAQAREVGVEFSKALFIVGQIGQKIFERGLDNLIAQFQERLTEALTSSITEGILSSKVFGAIDTLSDTARRVIGGIASSLLAVAGLVLSRMQSTADVAADGIESAIQSSEAVRGVISGDTSVSVKEQQENLAEAVEPVVDRLDVLIALTKRKLGLDTDDQGSDAGFLSGVATSGL